MKKILMALIASILLAACQAAPSDLALEAQDKEAVYFEEERQELIKRLSLQEEIDHLTFGIPDLPVNLNPLTFDEEADEAAGLILHTLYRDLFRLDEKEELHYDLLKDFRVEDDQHYHLVLNNVLWDDGHPLTADDIIFTIESSWDQSTRYGEDFVIDGIKPNLEKINDYEMTISLARPSHSFAYKLSRLLVVPKHIYQDVKVHSFGVRPEYLVGNGTYRLDREVFDTDFGLNTFRFLANEHSDKGPPKFSRLDYRVTGYSETNTSRYDMLAYTIQAGYIDPADVPAFDRELYNFSYFDGDTVALVFKLGTEIGGNPELREAFASLIPPSSVVGLYGGKNYVAEANTIFSASNAYRQPSPPFNQGTTQEALATIKDYQLGNPNFSLRFGFLIDIGKPQERLAIQLQELFRVYGINLELVPLYAEEYDYYLKSTDQDDLDLMLCQLPPSLDPDSYRRYFEPGGPYNYSGYENSDLMELFQEADREQDAYQRLALYKEIQDLILAEKALVPLVHTKKPLGMDDRLTHWEQADPSPYRFFNQVELLDYQPLRISDKEKEKYDIKKGDLIKDRPYENVNIKAID